MLTSRCIDLPWYAIQTEWSSYVLCVCLSPVNVVTEAHTCCLWFCLVCSLSLYACHLLQSAALLLGVGAIGSEELVCIVLPRTCLDPSGGLAQLGGCPSAFRASSGVEIVSLFVPLWGHLSQAPG